MKLRDIMSAPAIRVGAGEPVTVAARTLAQYDLGALPVCSADGKPVGLLTDRDIVTRCLAAGRDPGRTLVRESADPPLACCRAGEIARDGDAGRPGGESGNGDGCGGRSEPHFGGHPGRRREILRKNEKT